MSSSEPSHDFKFGLEHVEKLLDRRQAITSFYLSVNAGIASIIGLLLKDAQLNQEWLIASVLMLLGAGLIACWIWRSLLQQYAILLDWWYARLREVEAAMPDSTKLITREYQDLYIAVQSGQGARRIGMTKRELVLVWLFAAVYAAFATGIVVCLLT